MDNNIAAYFAGDIDADTAVKREVLKAAVMRQITCTRSGRVLDVRSAVYIKVTNKAGHAAAEVVDGRVWDLIGDPLTAICEKGKITLEVIDGRTING